MFVRDTFPVGMLQCNCSILADVARAEAIVVDPGDEVDRIVAKLATRGLKVTAIVHTHAHIDHIGGTEALAQQTRAPTYLHQADQILHTMLPLQAQLLGLPLPSQGNIDHDLPDATVLAFGDYELSVLHTPGHSPGSVCFRVEGQELCLTGDTLFAGGIGRTDLWGGDSEALCKSIQNRLYAQHGDVLVIPGHGPSTSIDRERRANPYVRGAASAAKP